VHEWGHFLVDFALERELSLIAIMEPPMIGIMEPV
jgi:hypothetical protein